MHGFDFPYCPPLTVAVDTAAADESVAEAADASLAGAVDVSHAPLHGATDT